MRQKYRISTALAAASLALFAGGFGVSVFQRAFAEPPRVFDPTRDAQPPDRMGGGLPDVAEESAGRSYKRTHADQSVTLFVYYNVDENCRQTKPTPSVQQAPQHGVIHFETVRTPVEFGGKRQRCNGAEVDGTAVVFIPAGGYIGGDEVAVRIVDGKFMRDDFYTINVRPLGMR